MAETKKDRSLRELTELAQAQIAAEKEVERIQAQLKDATERLDKIQTDLLPTAMEEIGMNTFTLADGSKIDLKPDVKCSISQARAPEAFSWLNEHGHGGIIRSAIVTEFAVGDNKTRDKVLAALVKLKQHPDLSMKVHPQTLKAFVNECLAGGIDIPHDLFGIFPYKKTVIKMAKAKK